MRKTFSIICCLFLTFFCSACSSDSNKTITVAEAGYTCDALVNYGENFSSNVTVKAIGGGMFSLTLNTPENISGLTFNFDNSEMSISYNGIDKENTFPTEYGGFAEILNEIFLKFTTSRPDIPYKNGKYLLEGNNSEYSFELTFTEEGFPLSLMVEDEELKVDFSNWMY